MDAKDLRTESAANERNNDGSKYSQSGGIALHCDRNKSYQDIGSNSLGKVDVPNSRPCAVIGPDRVVPPPATSEAYHLKKGPAEPWPCMDNSYRRPPEYPHKLTSFQNPTRNISPRQTFQENMQRIMVPATYNSIKVNDDTNYAQISDRSNGLSKNIKLNMPPEAKFCDVPYAVNPTNNEHKNVRNPEMCLPSANTTHTRTAPHGWPPGSVNLRSTRMYGAPELYQYQDYPSCAGPRPIVPRPHRTVPDEQGYVYADPYYQEGNIRFKPYPSVKERHPQQRYEYIGNYSNPFHPPPGFPAHKYEVQKSMPTHPYPPYPPIKYVDSRVAEPVLEGYPRNPQGLGANYNIQYRNQVIHPSYGPVVGNGPHNKLHSYPPDAHLKSIPPNKLPYDSNPKTYIEYENSRPKLLPPTESYFVNEMARMPMKSQVIIPNYSTLNMHNIPPNPYYKKDAQYMKNYEHMTHYRNMDPNLNLHNAMSRHAPVFSPNTLAISPTDSNTSNDTTQTHGTSQEDCGYVSQSSTASVRSIDSGINRLPNEYLRKYYDNRYGPIVRTSPMMLKSQVNSNNNTSKDKKQIDVRQFLQMWNEGDEEQEENGKEIIIQTGSSDKNNFVKSHEGMNTKEQLYVLGLVNVPSEELAKYEHIQKVSKLPENIKGYNSIELLNQFEEVIESSHMNNYKTPVSKESMYRMPMKGTHLKQTGLMPPRPVSPLDVESKISQSVIHKEVGCNFEIKPCSPKMLNVEVAAPIQNILAERSIEKVANTVMLKSPMLNGMNENIDCNVMKRTHHRMNMSENLRIPSCKMVHTQFANSNSMDPMKSSYSIQDLESNSGLCLASLPRLDNDIELNFPEVNQQFINANKGDSTVLANSIEDLPTLEVLDQSSNKMKDNFNNRNPSRPEYDVEKSPFMIDSEKEFSKLSKYRKSKTFEPKETLTRHNINAFRTDSVIIKNPENIKNHEEDSEFSNGLNKVIMDIQHAPINLTSQGSLLSNLECHPDINLQDSEKEKQLPVEIAIDFSLNKTGILSGTEYMESKIDVQINTSTLIEENSLNTLHKDDSSDSVSLLPVLTEENENFSDKDNTDGNCSRNSQRNCQYVPEPITDIFENNDEANFKELSASNQKYQKVEIEKSKCTSNGGEKMIVDVSIASLAKTKIPDQELNTINSEHCAIKICNNEDTATDKLAEDINLTLPAIDSDISLNPTEGSEESYKMDTAINTRNVTIEDFNDNNRFVDKLNSPAHAEIIMDTDTLDINYPSEISDSGVAKQTQQHDKNVFLISGEIMRSENSDLIQSQKMNLELQSILKDDVVEPMNDNSEEITTHSLEELPHPEKQLKDFEETNCERTQSSPKNTDLCDLDQSVDEDLEPQIDKPFRRNLWYGSKELYSPWIQKLLTFTEGSFDNSTAENNMDSNNVLVDSTETVNITTANTDDYVDSGKEIAYKYVTEDVNEEQDMSNKKLNEEKNSNENITENLIEERDNSNIVTEDVDEEQDNSNKYVTKDLNEDQENSSENVTEDAYEKRDSSNKNVKEKLNEELDYFNIVTVAEDMDEEQENSNIVTEGVDEEQDNLNKNLIEDVNEKQSTYNIFFTENFNEKCDNLNKNVKEDVKENQTQNNLNKKITEDENEEQSSSNNLITEKLNDERNNPEKKITDDVNVEQGISNNLIAENLNEKRYNLNKNVNKEQDSLNKHLTEDVNEIQCITNKIIPEKLNEGLEISYEKVTADAIEEYDNSNYNITDMTENLVENEIKDVREIQHNSNNSVKRTVETSIFSSSILDENMYETVNSDDHLEYKDITKDETINNKENEYAVEKADNVVAADTPFVTCKFQETNMIDPSLGFESDSNEITNINSETQLNSGIETQFEEPDTSSNIEDVLCESFQVEAKLCEEQPEDTQAELQSSDHFDHDAELCEEQPEDTQAELQSSDHFDHDAELCEKQPEDTQAELESSDHFEHEAELCEEQPEDTQAELESSEHVRFSFNGLQENDVPHKKCQRLKRSLSDSALNMYNNYERPKQDNEENVQFIWPFKRRKVHTVENDLLAQNLCNIIHHNRRNSVSSFYNEDNVSFCILIDNDCIITEEENEEPEKMCYTELSEECLAEIQSSCTRHEENIETLAEVVSSPHQVNACEYTDSFLLGCEEDKTLEESWDEDVGCVETVISDEIAEDIEICGTSPKDDGLSDNDESGVFSSSEHTDKVKFIYGEKMCNDDALFVETLYKTPQMDVNKTLYNRETRVSEEYDRYYDNDSLEKMLSESNERPVSPYVPQFMHTLFPSGKRHSQETPENKENMDVKTLNSSQSKLNIDNNGDKIELENIHSIDFFAKTRNDTGHSCESSVDNVFTYNQKDEDAIYTSSSPEVSSTTSEEKNSGILLKITNYKGSRISQINDISKVNNRPSCKFTEKKEYLHTHANYSSNRPLLTKGAQKYIPPLKESIRDLKVKLSLPQHSLMKLKQLKISKEEPKVNTQSATFPRIPKKPKPKFEDVLKSIDEIQFKKHKENTKKSKKAIPKVVIKKNQNGSHYASTSNKNEFNPDMTGRKWQPWVFIEKNHFIDKMATRKKTIAVYSHRKRTYVLAEKFQKYKSASSAKFVISPHSPPISDNSSSGLKYTIRLKHNY